MIVNVEKKMDSPLIKIDDKHVPLYRIVWVSDVPHFCGEPECMHEGEYEIRLDVDESVWTHSRERDQVIVAMTRWFSDPRDGDGDGDGDWT